MANYRIKLSDGTTTIDLLSGDVRVMEAGLDIGYPEVDAGYVQNPLTDGNALAYSRFGNRTITVRLNATGSSKADLATNVRAINRLLNDAEKRTLLGHGAQVYLEYQWGDSAGASIYFDVIRGSLTFPADFLSIALHDSYYVIGATLTLTCKPFGRYANTEEGEYLIDNSQSQYRIVQSCLTPVGANNYEIHGNNWACQTFQDAAQVSFRWAAILAYREGTITNYTFAIYATAAGKPTGAALATKVVDCSAVTTDSSYPDWVVAIFDSDTTLTAATTYALVVYAAGGDANNCLHWVYQAGTNPYASGTRVTSANAGSTWTIQATDDHNFLLGRRGLRYNYQDVSVDETYGDVPAKIYHAIELASAAGTGNFYVAKRSGSRYDDDLWFEGEDYDTFTDLEGGAHDVVGRKWPDEAYSNGLSFRFTYNSVGGAGVGNKASAEWDIATPPVGQYRVLIRGKCDSSAAANYDHFAVGMGWIYGSASKTPSDSLGEFCTFAADNTEELLDLGILNIPPIPESGVASNTEFTLTLFFRLLEAGGVESWNIYIDYIFLLPIDEGVVIVESLNVGDIFALDGIADPPVVLLINGSDEVIDLPDYVGMPFRLGRENTRIYVLRDDTPLTCSFLSYITYQPQFLLI